MGMGLLVMPVMMPRVAILPVIAVMIPIMWPHHDNGGRWRRYPYAVRAVWVPITPTINRSMSVYIRHEPDAQDGE